MSHSYLLLAALTVMLLTMLLVGGTSSSFEQPERLIRRLMAAGLIVRLGLALFVPAFMAPDEEAHFNVLRFIAEQRALPIQPAKLDFAAHDYEAYQPPLYYLLASVPYALGRWGFGLSLAQLVVFVRVCGITLWWGTAQVALRLLDVAAIVDSSLRVGIMAVLCFVPTQVYTSAAITNDNAVVFFATVAILGAATWRGTRGALLMGLVLSAAMLSKLSGAGACAGALSIYLLTRLEAEPSRARALAQVCVAALVASLGLLPWLARNLYEYGSLLALDRGNPVANWPLVSGSIRVARSLAGGFWAISGVESEIRQLPGLSFLLSCAVGAGCVATLVTPDAAARDLLRPPARKLMVGYAVAFALTLASAFSFGLRTGMPHGRLLFGALPSLAVLCAIGLRRVGAWVGALSMSIVGLPVGYTTGFVIVTLVAMGAPIAATVTVIATLAAFYVVR